MSRVQKTTRNDIITEEDLQHFEKNLDEIFKDRITIGPYTITPYHHGGFWIEHESGEGMQVSTFAMIELISRFYSSNF